MSIPVIQAPRIVYLVGGVALFAMTAGLLAHEAYKTYLDMKRQRAGL